MPARMPESHRIRHAPRMALLIENAAHYRGYITCEYCASITHSPQIEHFICRSEGVDPKDITNCLVVCPSCNVQRGTRPVTAVFGRETYRRVKTRLATRIITDEMWAAAKIIYRMTYRTERQIELIYSVVREDDGREDG